MLVKLSICVIMTMECGDFMKYNNYDLEKISKYEQKRGINYAKSDGKLYKTLFIIGFISWIYMLIMAGLYLLGISLQISEGIIKGDSIFFTILTATCISLISSLLYAFVSKPATLILNMINTPIMFLSFARISIVNGSRATADVSEYDPGILGLKKIFYIRHGVPMFVVFVICLFLLIIIFREQLIKKREYKIITENAYIPQIISKDE